MTELEGEVAEKEERLEEVMQELETRHSQLRDKDHQISSLHNDLNRVSTLEVLHISKCPVRGHCLNW